MNVPFVDSIPVKDKLESRLASRTESFPITAGGRYRQDQGLRNQKQKLFKKAANGKTPKAVVSVVINGTSIVNKLPFPSPSDDPDIDPPCNSTMPLDTVHQIYRERGRKRKRKGN